MGQPTTSGSGNGGDVDSKLDSLISRIQSLSSEGGAERPKQQPRPAAGANPVATPPPRPAGVPKPAPAAQRPGPPPQPGPPRQAPASPGGQCSGIRHHQDRRSFSAANRRSERSGG